MKVEEAGDKSQKQCDLQRLLDADSRRFPEEPLQLFPSIWSSEGESIKGLDGKNIPLKNRSALCFVQVLFSLLKLLVCSGSSFKKDYLGGGKPIVLFYQVKETGLTIIIIH